MTPSEECHIEYRKAERRKAWAEGRRREREKEKGVSTRNGFRVTSARRRRLLANTSARRQRASSRKAFSLYQFLFLVSLSGDIGLSPFPFSSSTISHTHSSHNTLHHFLSLSLSHHLLLLRYALSLLAICFDALARALDELS